MSPVGPDGPISLAVLDDHEVIRRGVAAMLAPFDAWVHVVEPHDGLHLGRRVDVALYDAFALPARAVSETELQRHASSARHCVLYTWRITEQVIDLAETRAMSGVLAKTLSAPALVEALEQICAGRRVVAQPQHGDHTEDAGGDWPGMAEGLTRRQGEIISLIVAGKTNREIAESCYLSPNSVKSYIRAAYQTMGVASRSEAILWGIDHGFRRSPSTRLLLRERSCAGADRTPTLSPGRADDREGRTPVALAHDARSSGAGVGGRI